MTDVGLLAVLALFPPEKGLFIPFLPAAPFRDKDKLFHDDGLATVLLPVAGTESRFLFHRFLNLEVHYRLFLQWHSHVRRIIAFSA